MNGELRLPTVKEAFVLVIGTLLLFMGISLLLSGGGHKSQLLILEAALILPVLIYGIIWKIPLKSVFKLKRIRLRLYLPVILIAFSFSVLSAQLGEWIQRLAPMSEEITASLYELMTIHTLWDGIFLISGAVIVASITEELLFRGLLQSTLERNGSAKRAVAVGAFVFALLHFNPWWFLEIILMGSILGIISWRSGSVLPCILLHIIINGISLFLVNMEQAFGWIDLDLSVPVGWLIIAFIVFCASIGLFITWTKSSENDGMENTIPDLSSS